MNKTSQRNCWVPTFTDRIYSIVGSKHPVIRDGIHGRPVMPCNAPCCNPSTEFLESKKRSSTSRYVPNSVTTILKIRYVHFVGGCAGGSLHTHLRSNLICLLLRGYTHPLCLAVLGRLWKTRKPCHGAGRRGELVSTFCSDPDRRRQEQSSRHLSARCCLQGACSGSIGYVLLRQPLRPTGPLQLHHALQPALM